MCEIFAAIQKLILHNNGIMDSRAQLFIEKYRNTLDGYPLMKIVDYDNKLGRIFARIYESGIVSTSPYYLSKTFYTTMNTILDASNRSYIYSN